MKNTVIYAFIILCFQITMSGCIDDISFKTDTGDGLLIVDGGFSDADEPQTIVLERTATYGSSPEPVIGAKVVVKSLDGKSGTYVEKGKGKYVLEPQILRGVVGQSYYVDITLSAGEKYQSEPEVLPARVTPDSIFWDFGIENIVNSNTSTRESKVINIYVSTPFKTENKDAFLKWHLYSNFRFQTLSRCNPFGTTTTCYFSKELTRPNINILSSKEIGLPRTNKARVDFINIDPGYPFLEKHYFSLYQYTISAKAYEYWNRINTVANQNGSIFDRAPASVKGNIFNKDNSKERIIGYFEVSSVAIKRVFVTGGEVKSFYALYDKEQYCQDIQYRENNFFINGCCNCLAIRQPNATVQQPSWWK